MAVNSHRLGQPLEKVMKSWLYPMHSECGGPGGIESVTASVARAARDAGHKVTVVVFNKDGSPAEQHMDGVRVLRAPISATKFSQPIGARYFRLILRESRVADLIHLHAPNMLAALAALLLGREPRLLVHWHSDVIGKGWVGSAVRPLEAALLERADRIVCTSQAYADRSDILRPYMDKVGVVPIGVPDVAISCASAAPLPRLLFEKIARRRVVLAVGRLVGYKGFSSLIDAAVMLPADVVVVIVGIGPLLPELRAQIENLGVQAKVVLAGWLDDSARDTLYRMATLYCLPSILRSEAFGVVLLEAMAYGLPIVATNIAGSGVPWVNQHQASGLNVTPGDPSALARAICTILDSDALRSRLAAGARSRYEQLFTERASNRQMLREYDRLVAMGEKSGASGALG